MCYYGRLWPLSQWPRHSVCVTASVGALMNGIGVVSGITLCVLNRRSANSQEYTYVQLLSSRVLGSWMRRHEHLARILHGSPFLVIHY